MAERLRRHRELMAHREGATLLWRVSLAKITESCAFSPLPGIDRVSLLVSGDGFTLSGSEWTRTLTHRHAAIEYPGEEGGTCELQAGESIVLNVMMLRGRVGVEYDVLTGNTPVRLEPSGGVLFVWCLEGEADVAGGPRLRIDEGAYTCGIIELGAGATIVNVRFRTFP